MAGIIQTLYDGLGDGLTEHTNTISSNMSSAVSAPLTAAMTLYILLYGFAIMRGMIQEPVMDFLARGIKLAIIWTLATQAGDYSAWVGDLIRSDIPQFVETLTGGKGNLPADSVMTQASLISADVREAYGSSIPGSFYGYLMSLVVMFFAAIFASITFVVSILVHFGLAIMAAIGPLFIAFALFDHTRGWFFGWLGQTVNFAILKLLVVVLSVVITSFVGEVYTNIDLKDGTIALFTFCVGLLCSTIFFFLLPSIASALTAGTGASTGALQRVVERKLLGGSGGGGNSTHSGSATRT
ncbi:type IV secretion system protein [Leisingera caerulea]|uniref:type IV secretion system protein n=1 Tax=Leisingera caerulea TaxID=506591 RepID=UPI0021A804F3|nr:type IV secretion system protein [Leisingera caerulea]